MKALFEAISVHARQRRRRVGIGILGKSPSAALVASLQEATEFADVITVGSPIPGCENVDISGEEAVSDTLVSMARDNKVDAIVRGEIYYTTYHNSLKAIFEFERDIMCPCLIKDYCENEWFITPVVQSDDCSAHGRFYLASQAAKICAILGVEPLVGVLAADTPSERGYSKSVDTSLDDAEKIVSLIEAEGYKCKMYPLRIDAAAKECNIVVPMDGTVGNFVCRSLVYLGGATMVGGFSLTNRLISLDTSKQIERFAMSIAAAAAMCNVGGMRVSEYSSESSS